MASYSRKSTRNKALWGYLLLIAVLLSSSWFVYHEINLLVSIKAVGRYEAETSGDVFRFIGSV